MRAPVCDYVGQHFDCLDPKSFLSLELRSRGIVEAGGGDVWGLVRSTWERSIMDKFCIGWMPMFVDM